MSSALQAARRYIEIGRPERALQSLADLDGETAATPEAHRLRGYAFVGVEDYDRAADEARDGLEDDPGSIDLLFLLSIAEELRGRSAAAEAAVLAALEQEPEDAWLLCRYAEILMRAGRLEKADGVLADAAAIEPDAVEVLAARQTLAYLRGHNREAKRLSRQLLAVDPESVDGHNMLGALDLRRGRARSAAARFGHAVQAEPAEEMYAANARQARRMARNPLWWPTLFFSRTGVIGSWLVAWAIIIGLAALGLTTAAAVALGIWWVLCIWSWVVPPILERLQR